MSSEWGGKRWCSAGACGCLGCVNGSLGHVWEQKHPDEAKISKEEFDKAIKLLRG